MRQESALIAMSGGVDSSVAAYLTQQQGYRCLGATMLLFPQADSTQDAADICRNLDMPFYVLDFAEDFRREVMDDFVRCYEAGLTPNPCVVCNKHLKFDKFLQQAEHLGCRYMVTGHYARIGYDAQSGRYLLRKALDSSKDQTYFLYNLTQHQLAHTLFPLGALTKQAAREIALEQGFLNAKKRDSQDICFVPDGDYMHFLREYTGKNYHQGDFVTQDGKVVGRHQGAVAYTIGQRKGLGLAMGTPVYVCGKCMETNTVTVGPNEALFHTTLLATDWNWISMEAPTAPIRALAKARSRMTDQPATVYPEENGVYRVVFDEAQRALTPGQAVVLYDGDRVIGGGTITQI